MSATVNISPVLPPPRISDSSSRRNEPQYEVRRSLSIRLPSLMTVIAFARAIPVALATVGALLSSARPAAAQGQPSSPISVHIAARTAFIHTDMDGAESSDEFVLDSVRLFLSGPVTDQITLTFNTEYDTVTNRVRVMDAIGRFEYSSGVNFWVGRFLPPSDRANLYGPYFSNHWAIFTDGIQDGYPFVSDGRANGAMYWGQFGKVSLSGGVFDGKSMTPRTTLVEGGRVQVDFWDPEPGYYSSGTYYGAKNVLALGATGQVQGADNRAMSLDALVERKVGNGGAVTFEGEFARYHRLGGYSARYGMDQGATRSPRTCCRCPRGLGASSCSARSRAPASARGSLPQIPTTVRLRPS